MVRGVERAVRLADRRQQAVERADDGDRERRDEQVVAEPQRERDAVRRQHRQQRVGQRNPAQERHPRTHVAVDQDRDRERDRGARREADELRRQRGPALAHDDEHDDRHEADEQRPAVDAAVVLVAALGAAVAAAAVRAEHFGQLVDDERDRESGHEARDDRVGDEARDVAEPQQAEQDLDDRRSARGTARPGTGSRRRRRSATRAAAASPEMRRMNAANRNTDDARGTSLGSSAPLRTNAVRLPKIAARQRGAQPGLDRVLAERRERDEPERQHHRDEHERRRDAGARLAREFRDAARRGGGRRPVVCHRRIPDCK